MLKNRIFLKAGREKSLKNFHPWIFSGAIQKIDDFPDGEIAEVFSAKKEFLATVYVNRKSSIIARVISFERKAPLDIFNQSIGNAIKLRRELLKNPTTNAYRLINGEGDFIPGLIVDIYNQVGVIQVATLGIEKLKNLILEILTEKLSLESIYEKSNLPTRQEEGLEQFEGNLLGEFNPRIEILENGLKFIVELANSQKTGFFLDQREMRSLVGAYSNNKRVLNCFAYSGAFSVYAAKHGSPQVDSVDISDAAIEQAKENFAVNQINQSGHNFYQQDAFDFLRDLKSDYDLIILDPPAFAKKKSQIENATRGYKDINLQAISRVKPGGFILTCSCSYYIDDDLFQKIVFGAAKDANRKVRVIHKHRLGLDHPVSLYHPEGSYLKSLLLYIE